MSAEEIENAKKKAERNPALWLLTLDLSRQRGELAKMRFAARKLAKMGIRVEYPPEGVRCD